MWVLSVIRGIWWHSLQWSVMGDPIKLFFILHYIHKILLKANLWISLLTESYRFDLEEDTGHGLIVWSVWLIIGTITWGLRNVTFFLYRVAKAVIVERWFSLILLWSQQSLGNPDNLDSLWANCSQVLSINIVIRVHFYYFHHCHHHQQHHIL
jgi:hypothetical protein